MANPGAIRALCMIPAATEWGYAPFQVYRDYAAEGAEFVITENGFSVDFASQKQLLQYNQAQAQGLIGSPQCDWKSSLDALGVEFYNVTRINLFVTWFGNNLNCGACQLYPAVTQNVSAYYPQDWSVAGISRAEANVVSSYGGAAAYGGTPADAAVTAAIRDLNLRGLAVTFTPFLLLDIPASNALVDPYTNAAPQPAYPWRGRITASYGTDKSSSAAIQIAAFVSQYTAFVMHYANLCAAAGGVDTFVLGTELRGLTWLRDGSNNFPFVAALVSLAASVKAVLPNANLVYSADWTEYFGYQPSDGSNDVYFHLDPLWSSPDIAAVGMDNYFPLSDYRASTLNLDLEAGWTSVYDIAYLQNNIRGGEGYSWYYANQTARDAQSRSEISDGAYHQPWVFRYKDIWNWWSNPHFNRPGGVQAATPTGWTPRSKPIWFMELGCPAVNFGSNQPNVFHDAKSSESAYPYYSSGARDDAMQGQHLSAWLQFLDPAMPGFAEANNPPSGVYNGRMIDISRIYIYCWDARPFPSFPYGMFQTPGGKITLPLLGSITIPPGPIQLLWGDGPNYETGHWIEGRSYFGDLAGGFSLSWNYGSSASAAAAAQSWALEAS